MHQVVNVSPFIRIATTGILGIVCWRHYRNYLWRAVLRLATHFLLATLTESGPEVDHEPVERLDLSPCLVVVWSQQNYLRLLLTATYCFSIKAIKLKCNIFGTWIDIRFRIVWNRGDAITSFDFMDCTWDDQSNETSVKAPK